MQIKRMTIRFDLDNPASMNRAVLAIVNQAEQAARIGGMVRGIIREELSAALRQVPVQSVRTEAVSEDGADDTIMDFLNSF